MKTVVLSPTNVATFPEGGGHFWVYMQYVQGLRDVGADVHWLEHFPPSGDAERDRQARETFFERARGFGLEGHAVLYEGTPDARVDALAERADLLLNFNYGIHPDVLSRFRCSALVDIDPGLLQHWMAMGQIVVATHDLYFTTGETVGRADALFDDCGLPWMHIRPAVSLTLWPECPPVEGAAFTTVSSWMGGVDGEWVSDRTGSFYDNNKRVSFLEYVELPHHTSQRLELALGLDESAESETRALQRAYAGYAGDASDRRRLEANGWRVRHAREVSSSPERYQRYVQGSRGEFSCAKPSCMRFRNAWVSDRTLCYLASGRPAIVQNTGPSDYLPNGLGLHRFSSVEDAAAALEGVAAHYDENAHAAREIAAAYFDARHVARAILQHAS